MVLILLGIGLILYFFVFKKKNSSNSNSNNKYPKKYNWVEASSTPSNCSVPCGGGTGYVAINCVDQNGNPAPVSQCDEYAGPKPSGLIPCNTQPCSWNIGDWSACSKTCGTGGVQTRTVTCPGSNCPSPQPPTSQSCFNGWCAWNTTNWNPECSSFVCGKGNQTRTTTCSVANPSDCGPQPVLTNVCDTGKSCSWQNGHVYPYPVPSMNYLQSLDGKTFNLALSNNQNLNLNLIDGQFKVANTNYTFVGKYDNTQGALSFLSSNNQVLSITIVGNLFMLTLNGTYPLLMKFEQVSTGTGAYFPDYSLYYYDDGIEQISLNVDSSGNVNANREIEFVSTALIPILINV